MCILYIFTRMKLYHYQKVISLLHNMRWQRPFLHLSIQCIASSYSFIIIIFWNHHGIVYIISICVVCINIVYTSNSENHHHGLSALIFQDKYFLPERRQKRNIRQGAYVCLYIQLSMYVDIHVQVFVCVCVVVVVSVRVCEYVCVYVHVCICGCGTGCNTVQHVAACCSVLQCVAACCSVLQCVQVWCGVFLCVAVC